MLTDERTLTVQRPLYQKVLYERAVELGVDIRFGCRIESIDESAPSVKLDSGEEIRPDLIVGADGQRSFHKMYLLNSQIQVSARKSESQSSEKKSSPNVEMSATYA